MKKNILLAGVLTAAILGVTACGGGKAAETTAATTAAVSTVEASRESVEESAGESTASAAESESSSEAEAAASTAPVEGELPTSSGRDADPNLEPVEVVMNKEDVTVFAEDIKNTVAAKDLQELMNLCSYPITVKLAGGEKQVIEESDVFETLDTSKLFSDKLVQAMAAVDASKLVSSKDGVVMGSADCGITFTDVEGNLAITAIVQ